MDGLVGPDGLARLLILVKGTGDAESREQVIEIIRRLHLKFYEEARLYWAQAQATG